MELEEIFDPESVKLRRPDDDFIADVFLHGEESPLDARFAEVDILSPDEQPPEEVDVIEIDMAGEGGNPGGGANVDFDRPNKKANKVKKLRGRRLSRRKNFKKIKSKFSKKERE